MSGFKRMQSKVFWGQMAVQDTTETSPLIGAISASSSITSLPNAYANLAMQSEESETSIRDSDDGSNGNITAIRVIDDTVIEERDDMENDGSERKRQRELSDDVTGEKPKIQDSIVVTENIANSSIIQRVTSSSTASPCNRSLDSGFSDSDRSNSPDIYDDGTPKRRKRRQRRIVTRGGPQLARKIHNRLSSLWKDSEKPPNPEHTSTPKAEGKMENFQAKRCMRPKEIIWPIEEIVSTPEQRFEDDRENSQNIVESTTLNVDDDDECLGDFLYACEPPEDNDAHGIINLSPIPGTTCVVRVKHDISLIAGNTTKSLQDTRSERKKSAVKYWLSFLVMETEDECCTTLQSKKLPRRRYNETTSEISQTRDLRILTSSATAAATELLVRADGFTRHLDDIVEKLSNTDNVRSERELLRSMEDEAFSILSELGGPPPRRIQQGNLRCILSQLENLRNTVDAALDTRLDFYIERVVRGLEEAPREGGSAARGALAALTALGLAGNRAGSSIARCSGIRSLLTSLVSAGRLSSDLRASSLRALASVCCCPLAIQQFVDEDGPEILLDLLAATLTPENEKMEATALIVQITAPWTNALGLVYLEPHARDLIVFLTNLATNTTCVQTLLLAAAALNNLADSRKSIEPMVQQDTIVKLLKCVKKSAGGNVWLMEQVAALIGKLAKIPEIRGYLANARASVALVCFLRMGTPGLEDAYRRLEITAAVALTRLCVEPEIARQVVAVGGADCLPAYDDKEHEIKVGFESYEKSGLLRYTRSLRRACKRAAREIDVAKACDYSLRG